MSVLNDADSLAAELRDHATALNSNPSANGFENLFNLCKQFEFVYSPLRRKYYCVSSPSYDFEDAKFNKP